MPKYVDVPRRGQKWVKGALLRDNITGELYRVTGAPRHYHEDCPAMQAVSKVRDVPAEYAAAQRLTAIMDEVRKSGKHDPASRGAYGRPETEIASIPARTPNSDEVKWTARTDANSYASFPSLSVRGNGLVLNEPIYDDSPILVWLEDEALATEARQLIATKPTLTRYTNVSVRSL